MNDTIPDKPQRRVVCAAIRNCKGGELFVEPDIMTLLCILKLESVSISVIGNVF